MRGKSLALLGLALGCGLVASIGITQVMAKRGGDPVNADTESIFVAVKDIGLGEFLNPEALRLEQWPKDKIPTGALTRMEDVEGRRTKTRLFAGEPILDTKLFRKGAAYTGPDVLVPKGFRAVPVKVDLSSGVAGMLLPGSRVDVLVFLTRNNSKDVPETTVRTVLQDIQVFAVNDVVTIDSKEQEATNKSIAAKTVSLLVTPEQGAKLTLASEMGKIKLMMRNPEDDSQGGVTQSRPHDIFEGAGTGDRERETLVEKPKKGVGKTFLEALTNRSTPAAASPEARPTWTVRVLEPGSIRDVVMEEVAGDPSNPFGGQKLWRPLNLTPPGGEKGKPAADPPATPGGASGTVAPTASANGPEAAPSKSDTAASGREEPAAP